MASQSFAKTGTHRQAQLVSLLADAPKASEGDGANQLTRVT